VYVHVNVAISADGKLSTYERRQVRISGDDDFSRVDRLRGSYDGLLVGVGTVHADDPSLTRYDESYRRAIHGPDAPAPARAVVDTHLSTPASAQILDGKPPTYILHGAKVSDDRHEQIVAAGGTPIRVSGEGERVDLCRACGELEAQGVESLLIEGGGEIIFSLFEAELVNRLTVFVGGTVIGGRDAPTLADGDGFAESFPSLELEAVEQVDTGAVLTWVPKHS
jgi:2,5-diamino-6-(ribosylamino)-4(3H)-pyrimidinone 5'-phosphate reductase